MMRHTKELLVNVLFLSLYVLVKSTVLKTQLTTALGQCCLECIFVGHVCKGVTYDEQTHICEIRSAIDTTPIWVLGQSTGADWHRFDRVEESILTDPTDYSGSTEHGSMQNKTPIASYKGFNLVTARSELMISYEYSWNPEEAQRYEASLQDPNSGANVDGWINFIDMDFILVENGVTWLGAMEVCTSMKAHLIEIRSADLMNLVLSMTNNSVWVGADSSGDLPHWLTGGSSYLDTLLRSSALPVGIGYCAAFHPQIELVTWGTCDNALPTICQRRTEQ